MRVNKYTVPLTRQELRRADFPGDFLTVAEELSVVEFFEDAGIFTTADRRRYSDAEYVSEILAALIEGVQDKKDRLDEFYIAHTEWALESRKLIIKRFGSVIEDIAKIFAALSGGIKGTRFRQKADFYSLFVAIDELQREGHSLGEKPLEALASDVRLLDYGIRPEADVDIFSEYAIKCVSQANSASSRRWRADFLKAVIGGTYRGEPPVGDERSISYRIMDDCAKADGGGMCPPTEHECPQCDEIVDLRDGALLAWGSGESVYQLDNACWIHSACATNPADWRVIQRPSGAEDDQPALL